ncbi:MAG TPA: ATP-binding domain-containing protein [Polyangia bacterium]|nr:ATP-binding domain-containing protein [Polyangia bacterium]
MSEELDPRHEHIITHQLALLAKARTTPAGVAIPYFGHLRLESGGRQRDVLLGYQTRITQDLTLLDWQNAPLAEVFFACTEGDEYEVEAGERVLAGTVLERNLLGFDHGELVDIVTADASLSRRGTGAWRMSPVAHVALLRPRDDAARARGASSIEVALDPVQERTVTLPPHRTVLVLGEAGSGKTTVALHRLAFLQKQAQAAGAPFRAAVIVPTEGLRRLSRTLLERLGVEGAETWLYDRWAAVQAQRAFEGLPTRESQSASAAVIRLKRHPALRQALTKLARRPATSGRQGQERKAQATRHDLLRLFGDQVLLERVVTAADGAIPTAALRETIEHTRVQFSKTTEREFAHVDRDRLETIDGRPIDEGTNMEDAETIDVEDYAVLFELDRLRAEHRGGPATAPRRYHCIVLDEAQEFAPLELALVGRSSTDDGTLIVAGDAGQQVDPTACFVDWPTTMKEAGADDHEVSLLEVSYRCPPAVTTLARGILSPAAVPPAAASNPPPAPSPDLPFIPIIPIRAQRFDSEFHQAAALIDALREITASGGDPTATIAIICRTPAGATRLARILRWGLDLRLALHGDFDFGPGVSVTSVEEVKGLEFDYVIVPDASSSAYPDTAEARRALYVAVTRTIHHLVLSTVGTWTPVLPASPRL